VLPEVNQLTNSLASPAASMAKSLQISRAEHQENLKITKITEKTGN
jgi:hypothetical protein